MTRTEAQKSLQWKAVDNARAKYVREYEQRFKNTLNSQIAPVIIAVKQGKAKPENYVLDIAITAVFKDLYEKVGQVFAVDAFRSLKAAKGDYLTKSTPQSQWMQFVQAWLAKEGAEKIAGISDTTKDWVKTVLQKGADEGLGTDEIAKLITEKAEDINIHRARLIARTEIVNASNKGSLEGAKSTGLELNKVWLATRDKRTRRKPDSAFDHMAADGQTVKLEEMFVVSGEKLEHPGDSGHGASAGNTIQCRCTQIYEPV